MRILLVEDEKYIARGIAEVLRKNYYSVDLAYDGEFGLDCAFSNIYDIIVLDIMIPKKNGLTVLSEMRKNRINTPVILLTARGQLEDKVKGLDLGADDYLAKPFHTEELLARLRALGRRKTEILPDGKLTLGDISLAPHSLMLTCGKYKSKLTLKESQLLELLIKNTNVIISKDCIIEKIWGYDADVEDNHVEAHVSLLRKKVSAVKSTCVIKTIRGAGYTLIAGGDS